MGVRKYIQRVAKFSMRAAIFPLMVVIFLPGMVSCSSDEPEEKSPENSRDAFVGEYDYISTGNLDIFVAGVKIYSLPLDREGSFEIVKEEEDNKVAIVGAIYGEKDSIHAIVTGNQLTLENNSVSYSNELASLQMALSYPPVTLTDGKMVCDANMIGIGTFQSYSITGNGHVKIEATKK